MKKFVAPLTTILLLVAFSGIVTAQEAEKETERQPMQMPMMQGMVGQQGRMMPGVMGGGMMGQMPMMQGGMMCPMCSQMMSHIPMMQMMGHGIMGQMPMMQMMAHSMMRINMLNARTLLALADKLKLKQEQIKSLKNISLNSQKESIKKGADLAIARIELNALLDQEEIDLEGVQQKIGQIANLEAELRIAHIKASIEAKKEKPMRKATEHETHHQ